MRAVPHVLLTGLSMYIIRLVVYSFVNLLVDSPAMSMLIFMHIIICGY